MAYNYSEKSTDKDYYMEITDPSRIKQRKYADGTNVSVAPDAYMSVAKPRLSVPSEEEIERDYKEGDQLAFSYQPPTVTNLYADQSMRYAIGPLLGRALSLYPDDLTADKELSQHSSPLAKKLIDLGALQGSKDNPEGDAHFKYHNNNPEKEVQFTQVDSEGIPLSYARMKNSDVEAARTKLRDVLRGSKQSKLSTQFNPHMKALSRFEAAHESEDAYDPSKDPNAMRIPGLDD